MCVFAVVLDDNCAAKFRLHRSRFSNPYGEPALIATATRKAVK